MARVTITFSQKVYRWQLIISLLLIFGGAVVVSKFDSWYAIVGGGAMATLGSFLNQAATVYMGYDKTAKNKKWFNILW